MDLQLKNKTAFISGYTAGIGLATAVTAPTKIQSFQLYSQMLWLSINERGKLHLYAHG